MVVPKGTTGKQSVDKLEGLEKVFVEDEANIRKKFKNLIRKKIETMVDDLMTGLGSRRENPHKTVRSDETFATANSGVFLDNKTLETFKADVFIYDESTVKSVVFLDNESTVNSNDIPCNVTLPRKYTELCYKRDRSS